MKYSEKLRKLRNNLGLKQSEVAEQIYVLPRAISTWELGENTPGVDLLIAMARIYKVSLDELLSEELAEVEVESVNVQGVIREMHFPEKLRMIRKQLKMSREKFAGYLDAADTSIYRWENGVQLPSLPLLLKLSKFLGMSIEELLYMEINN